MPDEIGLQGDTSAEVDVQATPATSAPAEPKYVTIEEAQRLANDAAEKAYTRAQSLVDKSSNRINEMISSRIEQIKTAYEMTGQTMTPEQEATLRQNVVMRTLTDRPVQTDPQQVPASPQPAQAQDASSTGIDPITATAIKMADSVGGFTEADPEYEKVMRKDLPPEEWLANVAGQVQAKKARTSSARLRSAGSTLVGVSGGGAVNPNNISGITDSAQLYALGEKQLRKRP